MNSNNLLIAIGFLTALLAGCSTPRPTPTNTYFEIPDYESYRDIKYDTSALLAVEQSVATNENSVVMREKLESLGYKFLDDADRDLVVFKHPDFILSIDSVLYTPAFYKEGVIVCGRCALRVRKPRRNPNEEVEPPRIFTSTSRYIADKEESDKYYNYTMNGQLFDIWAYQAQVMRANKRPEEEIAKLPKNEILEKARVMAIDNMMYNPEFRKALEKK